MFYTLWEVHDNMNVSETVHVLLHAKHEAASKQTAPLANGERGATSNFEHLEVCKLSTRAISLLVCTPASKVLIDLRNPESQTETLRSCRET